MSDAVNTNSSKNLAFSSITLLTSILAILRNDVCRHVMQQLAVIGCNATTSPQLVEIQTDDDAMLY